MRWLLWPGINSKYVCEWNYLTIIVTGTIQLFGHVIWMIPLYIGAQMLLPESLFISGLLNAEIFVVMILVMPFVRIFFLLVYDEPHKSRKRRQSFIPLEHGIDLRQTLIVDPVYGVSVATKTEFLQKREDQEWVERLVRDL